MKSAPVTTIFSSTCLHFPFSCHQRSAPLQPDPIRFHAIDHYSNDYILNVRIWKKLPSFKTPRDHVQDMSWTVLILRMYLYMYSNLVLDQGNLWDIIGNCLSSPVAGFNTIPWKRSCSNNLFIMSLHDRSLYLWRHQIIFQTWIEICWFWGCIPI